MAGISAFGKIPSAGDFLRIDAPPAFVIPWDTWLQSVLRTGGHEMGAQWKEIYLSAPIWRFTLAAGVVGPIAWQGVLMPSVDRVGRMFPLTLFTALVGDPIAAHRVGATAFAALEEIALDALEDTTTRDRLHGVLEHLDLFLPSTSNLAGEPGTARRVSLWSAQVGDDIKSLVFDGLPNPVEAMCFFDLSRAPCTGAATMDLS